jgi:hypothetical protein
MSTSADSITFSEKKELGRADEKRRPRQYAEKLLLPDGYTIIEVKAEDRFNRSTKKRLEIIVKD